MRAEWYGDKRDLIKWGTLLELARGHKSKHVLQVLYFRPTEWGQLEIDDKAIALPFEVIQHFRQTDSVASIEDRPCEIEVFSEHFHNRRNYLDALIPKIKSRHNFPGIIFLDPDTGLEPQRKAGLEHVLESEVKEIWGNLCSGDLLVLYQHKTNRNGGPWMEAKKIQFENALGLPPSTAKVARAPQIAADVVFFYASRS